MLHDLVLFPALQRFGAARESAIAAAVHAAQCALSGRTSLGSSATCIFLQSPVLLPAVQRSGAARDSSTAAAVHAAQCALSQPGWQPSALNHYHQPIQSAPHPTPSCCLHRSATHCFQLLLLFMSAVHPFIHLSVPALGASVSVHLAMSSLHHPAIN